MSSRDEIKLWVDTARQWIEDDGGDTQDRAIVELWALLEAAEAKLAVAREWSDKDAPEHAMLGQSGVSEDFARGWWQGYGDAQDDLSATLAADTSAPDRWLCPRCGEPTYCMRWVCRCGMQEGGRIDAATPAPDEPDPPPDCEVVMGPRGIAPGADAWHEVARGWQAAWRMRNEDVYMHARRREAAEANLAECEADARRFRWLLDGNGYFMEEQMLCGHWPCGEDEQKAARREIDEAMERYARPRARQGGG